MLIQLKIVKKFKVQKLKKTKIKLSKKLLKKQINRRKNLQLKFKKNNLLIRFKLKILIKNRINDFKVNNLTIYEKQDI
jgi:hypothetical protein